MFALLKSVHAARCLVWQADGVVGADYLVYAVAQESLMLPGLGSDWEIDPANIAILRRPDGSEWELGSGASGRVWSSRVSAVAAALEISVEDYGSALLPGLEGDLEFGACGRMQPCAMLFATFAYCQ